MKKAKKSNDEDEGRRPTRNRRPSARFKNLDDDDEDDLSTTVRYRTRPRAQRNAYGEEEMPTRFSSRTGAKVSYAESDEEFEGDSRLVETEAASLIPKVDQVMDHAKYIAGSNVTFEDWKAMSIIDKKKVLLDATHLPYFDYNPLPEVADDAMNQESNSLGAAGVENVEVKAEGMELESAPTHVAGNIDVEAAQLEPIKTEDIQVENVQTQAENIPTQAENVQAQTESVQAQAENVQTQVENVQTQVKSEVASSENISSDNASSENASSENALSENALSENASSDNVSPEDAPKQASGEGTSSDVLLSSEEEEELARRFPRVNFSDPETAPVITKYRIKWEGKSHIHNSWETAADLMQWMGYKKVENYMKQVQQHEEWRKKASKEEIEPIDIQREMQRDIQATWCIVERILEVRPKQGIANGDKDPANFQYFVKWIRLPYDQSTWEEWSAVKAYEQKIADYRKREDDWVNPRPYIGNKVREAFTKFDPDNAKWLHCNLRDYQIEGLNWMIYSFCNNTKGILADEMGLGKTVQTLSFCGWLQNVLHYHGPFLVVVPLSTLGNWQSEVEKWLPSMNCVVYTGAAKSREVIRDTEFYFQGRFNTDGKPLTKFHILLTTYELVLKDKDILSKINWNFLGVDEAHRLKNIDSALHEALKSFETAHRLLITGTPLQNNLKELWSLLHFLEPRKFWSQEQFEARYSDLSEEARINELHGILKPHLLRRLKKDVEKSLPAKRERILRVPLSPMQKRYYKWILTKNFTELNKSSKKGSHSSLLNIVVELKKICNHPYLFSGAEDASDPNPLQGLISHSGKMVLLDKLLVRLQETGHRVLIFSQMVKMLDILSDYLRLKGFLFQRLDGSMSKRDREMSMESFNAEGSRDFCFLLSTRAGGLGINLTTADTVIIIDSDWNPQNDLQAEARAHRIGQKNVVNIYRFIAKGTVEEDILERAKKKMVLDHLVIQRLGNKSIKTQQTKNDTFSKTELAAILKFGAAELFKGEEQSEEVNLDQILERAEVRTEEDAGEEGEGELLNAFKVASFADDDVDFWKNIIDADPSGDALSRKRKNRGFDQTGKDFDYEEPEEKRARLEGEAVGGRRSQRGLNTEDDGLAVLDLNQTEVRRIINCIKVFGGVGRIDEIVKKAAIKKPPDVVGDAIYEIVETSQRSVRAKPTNKRVTFKYKEVSVNATALIQRQEDMDMLKKLIFIPTTSVEGAAPVSASIYDWRLAPLVEAPLWAACKKFWKAEDDAMLLVGIHKHGFGSWELIRKDQNLGLEKKIAPSSPVAAQKEPAGLPGPTQLSSRAETLLKLLREATGRKPVGGGSGGGGGDDDEGEDDDYDGKEKKKGAAKKRASTAGTKRVTKAEGGGARSTKAAPAAKGKGSRAKKESPAASTTSHQFSFSKPSFGGDDYEDEEEERGRARRVGGGRAAPGGRKKRDDYDDDDEDDFEDEEESFDTDGNDREGECIELLRTIEPHISEIKQKIKSSFDKAEKAALNRKFLLTIGDRIEQVANPADPYLTRCLWNVASIRYTRKTAKDLKSVYQALKYQK
eukprot:TRINITY_DN378_c0_g1_i1.p1 TRINITY_DN378_c0_g1~~TRINITY_DN378_c0_g1_i1.p1  ORF type:complete len:1789 (-),score=447.06 TRINITY_DN378_c0_g1_i1:34-4668(-)